MLSEVIEWDVIVITCVQQSFRRILSRLTCPGGDPRDHRHRIGLEPDGGEVCRAPCSVNSIDIIRRLLERKYDAIDKDGGYANCCRR